MEPDSVKHIFIENVMKLDPQMLTDNGFRCFDRFFRHVNCNDHKLRQWRRTLLTDSLDLMGLEYLWEVILTAQQGIAHKAIDSMKDIYTNLTPQLKERNVRGRGREEKGEGREIERRRWREERGREESREKEREERKGREERGREIERRREGERKEMEEREWE